MPFPINAAHRLLLENGSYLLLEDNSSKVILDEVVALDDPVNAGTGVSTTPTLTFAGEQLPTTGIALVSHTSVVGGTSTITSGSLDTTNANFIVINIVYDSAGSLPTLTDNKGNVWAHLAQAPSGGSAARNSIFYTSAQITGPGHTFTAIGNLSTMEIAAFSGMATSNVFGGVQVANSSITAINTFQAGSITPRSQNSLIISGLGFNAAGTPTSIDSSFTKLDEQNFGAANNYGSAMAYLIQTNPAAVNPTWTRTGTADTNSAINAVFLGAQPLSYEVQIDTVNTFNSGSLLDKNSTLEPGFIDATASGTEDHLMLEDGTSFLLLETGSKMLLNRSYPNNDYVSFTVQSTDFLLGGQLYYWRVRPILAGGAIGPWSSTQTFTTLRPTNDYSFGAYASLPTGNSRLTTPYTPTQTTNVANISNTTDVNDVSTLAYRVHQFAVYQATPAQITATFKGKAGQATSVRNAVLQVYNNVTPGWETLTTDSTTSAGATLNISGSINATFAPYYDGSNYATFRVYQ